MRQLFLVIFVCNTVEQERYVVEAFKANPSSSRSLQGGDSPNHNQTVYSVSQKIPLRLSEFFSFFHKRLRNFNLFLHTYYTFLCTLDYNFLFNYLQL